MAPNLRPNYEDGLQLIDTAERWPRTTVQLANLVHGAPETVRKAAKSLIKEPPHSKTSALIIWCRMNHQGQNERYMEVLGYDPWKYRPEREAIDG